MAMGQKFESGLDCCFWLWVTYEIAGNTGVSGRLQTKRWDSNMAHLHSWEDGADFCKIVLSDFWVRKAWKNFVHQS